MRKLTALLLLVVASCALFVLTPSVTRVATHTLFAATRVAHTVVRFATAPAFAEDILQFKPISAESAAVLESRRSQRREQATSRSVPPVPAVPMPPAIEAVPAVPAPPRPVRIDMGRSGNVMRVGSDIHIEADQTVVGNVLAVGGDVTVDGHVEGNVESMGGDVYLNSGARVDGDVVCVGGQLHEEDGAVVGGQRVTATGGKSDGVKRRLREKLGDEFDDGGRHTPNIGGALIWMIVALAIGWGFASLAPGRTGAAMETLKREPGASALTGFLALMLFTPIGLALVLVGALLCITIIGIPLALAAWFFYFAFAALVWIWGFAIGAATLGKVVAERRSGRAPSLVEAALWGTGLFGAAQVLNKLFHMLPGLGAIGTLLGVLAWIALGVFTMMGSGAWLQNEIKAGTLTRWWRNRSRGPATDPATGAWTAAPAATVPPAAPGMWTPGGAAPAASPAPPTWTPGGTAPAAPPASPTPPMWTPGEPTPPPAQPDPPPSA